jgi:signal transduction histidine kinase
MKLSNKIILTVILSVIVLNVFYFVYRISLLRNSLDEMFEKRMENLLFTTIEGAKQPLYNLDFKNLEFFINTIFMDESVKGAVFRNKFNVTIAFLNSDKIKIYKSVDEDKIDIPVGDDIIVKRGTITYNNLNEKVELYFTRSFLEERMDGVLKDQLIEFSFTVALLSILLFITIQRIVLNPIKRLIHFSAGISSNLVEVRHALAEEKYGNKILRDLNTIIVNERRLSNDELGDLQHIMVEMANTVKNSFKTIIDHSSAIENINNELEEIVESRTKELKQTNSTLQDTIETLKKTQEQMIQQEKMAGLGSLVAGVAHEINTPVGIGVTAASHLEEKTLNLESLSKEGKMKKSDFMAYISTAVESSRMILSNLNRAAELINSFKKVAVDQTNENKRSFDLLNYLNEIILSLNPKIKKSTHKILIDVPNGIILDSYPGAVSQVFTNLIMNSLIHGFEGVEYGEISISAKIKDKNVSITYQDNGVGASEEIVKKIFDPFFTTKRGFGGSGLGMNIVYNTVIEQLKGYIVCTSSKGEGMNFEIEFPLEI